MPERITSTHLHKLQAVYYDISNRGICVDVDRIARAKIKVQALIAEQLEIASKQWGIRVYVGSANAVKGEANAVNLNTSSGEKSLLNTLQKTLGYTVPTVTKRNNEGDYEQKYSAGELALQKMLSTNQFGLPNGDAAIRAVLRVRELGKLDSSYLNASLSRKDGNYLFLSSYNVAGTLSGRRSSKKHSFGFGNNGQNFPSHSDIAAIFRSCLVARPGNIFLMVDQMQAEDWPVSALSANYAGLAELKSNTDPDPEKRIDRHSKMATAVFGRFIPSKSSKLWVKAQHDDFRYMGKKVRHASNYGMRAPRMSDSLAQEGKVVDVKTCATLLYKADQLDPSIKLVFHKYIRDCLEKNQMLQNPFGRERMFLGARPHGENNSVFNEAYSWIPQSTVGDQTGFAVAFLEDVKPRASWRGDIVQEGHDSIVQDIPRTVGNIHRCLTGTVAAFSRNIRFYNGIEVEIPIEAEIGYDFDLKVGIETFDEAGVIAALAKLDAKVEARRVKELLEA